MSDSGVAPVRAGADRGIPTRLDVDAYLDPRGYERERSAIFARHWLFVADVRSLSEPGSYRAVLPAGFPLVVVNDAGTLRGFHNVCRHRGGPLVWPGDGSCSRFVCRYHGWSYGLDGALRQARDFGAGGPLDLGVDVAPGGVRLGSVSVQSWRGLVFAALDPDVAALADWLGPVVAACDPYPVESFRLRHRAQHRLACNWKVYAENYQEGYHIPLVHPGLNRQIDASAYEVEVDGPYAVHRAPARDGAVTSGAWLWRFPGLALNLYGEGMSVESYWPSAPEETVVEYAFFFADDVSDADVEAAVASSTTILDEDRVICEAVQRNYASGLYSGGRLSPRHEHGVDAVQGLVLEALGGSGG